MDNQEMVALVGIIIVAVVNIGVLFWNIRQTNLQLKETGRLTKLTASLQNQVNRLSIGLNQEIARLNRIRDLTNGVYLAYSKNSQKSTIELVRQEEQVLHFMDVTELSLLGITLEEWATAEMVITGSLVEMKALGDVIDNDELKSAINEFEKAVPRIANATSQKDWFAKTEKFDFTATALHKQVYQLLKETTDNVYSKKVG